MTTLSRIIVRCSKVEMLWSKSGLTCMWILPELNAICLLHTQCRGLCLGGGKYIIESVRDFYHKRKNIKETL